jgi:hypothetical protein
MCVNRLRPTFVTFYRRLNPTDTSLLEVYRTKEIQTWLWYFLGTSDLVFLLVPLILVRLLPVSSVICRANHKRYHMSQTMKWNGVKLGNPFVPVFFPGKSRLSVFLKALDVPQNSIQSAKCPKFFQVVELGHVNFSTVGENIYTNRTTVTGKWWKGMGQRSCVN